MDSRDREYIEQTIKNGSPTIVINDVVIPSTVAVCGLCNGKGTHVNPGIDSNGISAEEFAERGEDFQEDYFSGHYDVECAECRGNKVVAVIDYESCDKEQADIVKEHEDYIDEENHIRSLRERGIEY